MITNQDLLETIKQVMEAKRAGKESITINGYKFVMDEQGMCQKFCRQAFESTTGRPMPGKDSTAQKSYKNLMELANGTTIQKVVSRGNLKPGDFIYISMGTVGHVGIYVDEKHIAQNTSRNGLGITDANFTKDQWSRWLMAFRLLPLANEPSKSNTWGLAVNAKNGDVIGVIPVAGVHNERGRIYFTTKDADKYEKQVVPQGILDDNDTWGKLVSLETGKAVATILVSGINRVHGRVYVNLP